MYWKATAGTSSLCVIIIIWDQATAHFGSIQFVFLRTFNKPTRLDPKQFWAFRDCDAPWRDHRIYVVSLGLLCNPICKWISFRGIPKGNAKSTGRRRGDAGLTDRPTWFRAFHVSSPSTNSTWTFEQNFSTKIQLNKSQFNNIELNKKSVEQLANWARTFKQLSIEYFTN